MTFVDCRCGHAYLDHAYSDQEDDNDGYRGPCLTCEKEGFPEICQQYTAKQYVTHQVTVRRPAEK